MKKISILFTALLAIFLVACSQNDKAEVKPPTEPLLTLSQELGKPPDLIVGPDSYDEITFTVLDKYCWEEEGKTCDFEPDKPIEILLGYTSMTVQQGDTISMDLGPPSAHAYSPSDPNLRKVDRIDLVQLYKGEESEVVVESNDEVDTVSRYLFTIPKEPGRYYYSATVRWDGDFKGKANYAFSFSVK